MRPFAQRALASEREELHERLKEAILNSEFRVRVLDFYDYSNGSRIKIEVMSGDWSEVPSSLVFQSKEKTRVKCALKSDGRTLMQIMVMPEFMGPTRKSDADYCISDEVIPEGYRQLLNGQGLTISFWDDRSRSLPTSGLNSQRRKARP